MAVVQRKDLNTPLTKQVEYYSDFFDNMESHPIKKDILRATNENAVKQSIKNLLLTDRGEHFFDGVDVGSDVRKHLFENSGPASDAILAGLIRTLINNHERRCSIIDVLVTSDEGQKAVAATIIFSLINKQDPITLEVILDRIR